MDPRTEARLGIAEIHAGIGQHVLPTCLPALALLDESHFAPFSLGGRRTERTSFREHPAWDSHGHHPAASPDLAYWYGMCVCVRRPA